ncbi:MAG: hypothetical protein QM831_23215 [Kofleriaceae bacterium]
MKYLLLLLVACGQPAPIETPKAPSGTPYAHDWLVENHILSGNTALTEGDAQLMHGRKVEVTDSSYRSPFQGSCDDTKLSQRTRAFDDVASEVDLSGDRRQTAQNFGITGNVIEYRLECKANTQTPPLVLFAVDKRAMTCFSGVCYLLTAP